MTEVLRTPFVVDLDRDRISVRSDNREVSNAIREDHFSTIDPLIADIHSNPSDLATKKRLGLLLFRELPLSPQDPWSVQAVFTIRDRDVWGQVPWEFIYDGTGFPLEGEGARFQVFTGSRRPGEQMRLLGPLSRLKVVMVSTYPGTFTNRDKVISLLGESAGFYHLNKEDPRSVRRQLQGIQPDIVLMDANSSTNITSSYVPMPSDDEPPAEGAADAKAEADGQPSFWNEATAEYLFAGVAPPLVIAPSNEEFALDALATGVDQVVLASRYPLMDEDFYEFVLALLQALSPETTLSMSFDAAVNAWHQGRSELPGVPLLYSRFRVTESQADDELDQGIEQAGVTGIETKEDDDRPEQEAVKIVEASRSPEPETVSASPLPAPDLRTATELSSYRSDVAATRDSLGVQSDVENLCQVIMAEKWKPPLSIGLFGDWGSGKTSFINLMQHMISATADRARTEPDSAFVSNVIQIEFNAWHYMDANLWANLVVRILDGIHAAVFERERGREEGDEAKQIIAHLHVLQEEVEKTENRQRQLASTAVEIDIQINARRSEQETTEGRINTLRTALADSDNAIAKEKDDVIGNLKEAANKLGFDAAGGLAEAKSQLRQLSRTGARLARAWQKLGREKLWWLVLPLAAVTLWIGTGLDIIELSAIDELVASIATAAAAVVSWLNTMSPQLKTINAGLDAVEAAQVKVDRLRSGWLAAKQKELDGLEAQRDAALTEISSLEARRIDIDKEKQALMDRLDQLQQGRGLEEFLLERAGSADYQEQLGIIALVHQDMKELQRKLRAGLQVEIDGNTETRRYDRVILYIDDLDRCTPERVVEVLQAVHLLLSIPLFVVVVAADPRWLQQCLLTHYEDLLNEGFETGESEWAVTPQNYLEKIFQIPFTLPSMASRDFTRYVDELFSEEEAAPDTDQTEVDYRRLQNEVEYLEIKTDTIEQHAAVRQDAMKGPERVESQAAADVGSEKPAAASATEQMEPPPERVELEKKRQELVEKRAALRAASRRLKDRQREALSQLPTFESNPRALNVPKDERAFVTQLLPLLTTPRTTKRMLNVYRLIRVSLGQALIDAFERSEHQAVLVLLAVMYSYPAIAADFFTGLRSTGADSINDFAAQMSSETNNGDWKRLSGGLSRITAIQDINVYRRWASLVGRYSFQVGHELMREQG